MDPRSPAPVRRFGFEPLVPVDEKPQTQTPAARSFGFAPIDEAKPPVPPANMGWGDVAGQALVNAPSSAWNVAKSTVEPFLSPVQTAKNIGDIGRGLYSKAEGLFVDQDPAKKAEAERAANAVGEFYSNRYGTLGGFKNAIATDPVGVLADVTVPLTLGGAGAARVPGAIGTAGRAIQKVGEAVDPLNAAVRGAAATVRGVAHFPFAPILSLKTGVSVRNLRDAERAGYTKNPEFVNYLKGNKEPAQLVDEVQGAIRQIAKERSDAYVSGTSGMRADQTLLPYDDVWKAYDGARELALTPNGLVKNSGANEALMKAHSIISEWQAQAPVSGAHTMMDFDALKRRLDELRSEYPNNPTAQKAVSDVRASVYNTVRKADPEYAKVMDDYAKASDMINELNKEVIGPAKGAVGAKLRKILRAQDDVHKGQLIDELTRVNPNLPYMIAGAELHNMMPKGLLGRLGALGAISYAYPPAIASAVLASPRVSGNVQYNMGRAARGLNRAGEIASPMRRAVPYAAGELSERVEEAPPLTIRPDRPARAAGGSVHTKATTAETLMKLAERARKDISNGTKSLLSQPDEAIAGALKAAGGSL